MRPDPFHAIENAIEHYRIDDILISTLKGEQSKWLEEGRMEARLIEGVPRVARYLRAAITKILLEHRPPRQD